MSEIKIEVVRDVTLDKLDKLDGEVNQFVKDAAGVVEGNLAAEAAKPKTGREYKRKGGGVHIASAPGESPASDQANLYPSIHSVYPSTLEAVIGTNVPYAPILEAADGLNRPLWSAVAESSLPTLEKMLDDAVRGINAQP